MISIESTGKNVQKAIEEGLSKLNKSIDEVDITILSSGGFLKKAKVEIKVIEDKPVRAESPVQNKQHNQSLQAKAETKPEQRPEQKQKKESGNRPVQEHESLPKANNLPKETKNAGQAKQETAAGNADSRPSFKAQGERNERFKQGAQQPSAQNEQGRPVVAGENEKKQARPISRPAAGQQDEGERRERPRTPITQEAEKEATGFISDLLTKMGVEFSLDPTVTDGELTVCIRCESGAIIGYRGETLDAIEYLTSLAINKSDDKYYRINVDCNDYRSKRVETLTSLARRMAEKAVKTGRKVVLDPMTSSSRKIIHSVLAENERIITKSEGRDPTRRIIIIPKRYK